MDENEVKNQEIETQEITDVIEVAEPEVEEIKDVTFRHPQQILTNKEVQNLFRKQAKVNEENAEREKRGEEAVEGLTETEKGAIKLFLLRARHHGSKPKVLTAKQRTALKAKRKASRKSRKINR
ncbi:MAG TPA: hypothetical protein VL946_05745 [Lacibacter sp.]|nr:hypothetical protein [Lacibacter sp.]